MMGRANNNTSPQSEEEEPFPKTPTSPSADAHFNVLSSSPTNLDLLPIRQENDELTKKSNTTVEITCNTCSRPVTDTFLELANHFYHKEVGRHKHVSGFFLFTSFKSSVFYVQDVKRRCLRIVSSLNIKKSFIVIAAPSRTTWN